EGAGHDPRLLGAVAAGGGAAGVHGRLQGRLPRRRLQLHRRELLLVVDERRAQRGQLVGRRLRKRSGRRRRQGGRDVRPRGARRDGVRRARASSKGRAMAMNVKPVPALDDRINEIRMLTAKIVNRDILPHERELWALRGDGTVDESARARARALRHRVQENVKQAGLWAPHLPPEYGGAGLSFLEHAYMNEVLAYSIGAASLFGVVAPNSGNQKILLRY